MMRTAGLGLVIGSILTAVMSLPSTNAAPAAQTDRMSQRMTLELPAQPLGVAIATILDQKISHIDTTVISSHADDWNIEPLQGEFTAAEALDLILRKTPFCYRSRPNAVVIYPKPEGVAEAALSGRCVHPEEVVVVTATRLLDRIERRGQGESDLPPDLSISEPETLVAGIIPVLRWSQPSLGERKRVREAAHSTFVPQQRFIWNQRYFPHVPGAEGVPGMGPLSLSLNGRRTFDDTQLWRSALESAAFPDALLESIDFIMHVSPASETGRVGSAIDVNFDEDYTGGQFDVRLAGSSQGGEQVGASFVGGIARDDVAMVITIAHSQVSRFTSTWTKRLS